MEVENEVNTERKDNSETEQTKKNASELTKEEKERYLNNFMEHFHVSIEYFSFSFFISPFLLTTYFFYSRHISYFILFSNIFSVLYFPSFI